MTHYGIVAPDALEATIVLTIQGENGSSEDILCIIDTGDTGDLSLPPAIIDRLGLLPIANEEPAVVILADGSTQPVRVYFAYVLWHGQMREVEVVALGTEPLVGMRLLRGSNLNVDAVPGGLVAIAELPVPAWDG